MRFLSSSDIKVLALTKVAVSKTEKPYDVFIVLVLLSSWYKVTVVNPTYSMRTNLNHVNVFFCQLIFYYGATDHWCPVQYYHDIRKDFPEGDIRLCERGIRHAFVLDAGEEMANMTAEWVFDDLRML